MILQLDPKTIWLKDVVGRCYFPDGEIFKTEDMEEHTYTLLVEGWPPASSEKYNFCFVVEGEGVGGVGWRKEINLAVQDVG